MKITVFLSWTSWIFCFIPIQISHNLWGTKDGTKFWWVLWFPAKSYLGCKIMRNTVLICVCVREIGRENKENYLMMPSASFNFVWPKKSLYSTRKKRVLFLLCDKKKNSWKYSMHNADVSSYYIRGFQINDFVLQSCHNLRLWNAKFTRAKLIWDRSTVSSIEPKFDNLFFDNLHVLDKLQIILVLICKNGRTILVFLLVQSM